jgi:hypothetical protein
MRKSIIGHQHHPIRLVLASRMGFPVGHASRSNFLVHVNVLARLFRGKMLAMLMHAHGASQLKFFNTHAGLGDKRTFSSSASSPRCGASSG